MRARQLRRLAPILAVVALVGLFDAHGSGDRARFDDAPRVTAERTLGPDAAVAPSRGSRVELERGRDPRPGDLVPVALGPANPAAPANGQGSGAVDAPDDRRPVTSASGSSRPRAPPVV